MSGYDPNLEPVVIRLRVAQALGNCLANQFSGHVNPFGTFHDFFGRIAELLEGQQPYPVSARYTPPLSPDDPQMTALQATAKMGTAGTDAAAKTYTCEASTGTNVLV
ncbi:hypothetical protein MY4824_004013 [Beauveria thailandica]